MSWSFTFQIANGIVRMPAVRTEDRGEALRIATQDCLAAGLTPLAVIDARRCDPSTPVGRSRDWWRPSA